MKKRGGKKAPPPQEQPLAGDHPGIPEVQIIEKVVEVPRLL